MSSIQNLFQQAQLAEAAYSNFIANPGNPELALTTDDGEFSAAQAAAFVDQWTIIDQYTAPSFPNLTGSGFSATVFKNKATGQYTFAIRGTEATNLSDWAADIFGIGGKVIALRQALDLYNYRKSLDTPLGQAYQAVYLKSSSPAISRSTARTSAPWPPTNCAASSASSLRKPCCSSERAMKISSWRTRTPVSTM